MFAQRMEVDFRKPLLRQAHDVKDTPAYDERMALAVRFIERFEPRARGVLAEIEATGGSLLGRVLSRPSAGKKTKPDKPVANAAE